MKIYHFLIVAFASAVMSVNLPAQKSPSKTEKIKISGNCSMCKTTIEKAAKVRGVINAEWNAGTDTLTLIYDPAVTSSETVQKSTAAAGYDTEKYKADEKAYNSLPGCCKYEQD